MVAVNDIIQITTKGSLQGQDILNVFHYQVGTVDSQNSNLEQLTITWFPNFDTQILAELSEVLLITSVLTENLTDGVSIFEASVNANGDIQGECLPAHDTYSFKLTRQTKVTRNGRKSFSGIPEGNQNNGDVVLSAANITQMENFLSQPVELDVNNDPLDLLILNPVIVGRTLDVNGVYQLDLSKINNVVGAVLSPRIRTQNTRKN